MSVDRLNKKPKVSNVSAPRMGMPTIAVKDFLPLVGLL